MGMGSIFRYSMLSEDYEGPNHKHGKIRGGFRRNTRRIRVKMGALLNVPIGKW